MLLLLLLDCVDDDNLKQFEELHKAKLRVAELEEKLLRKKSLDFNVDHFFAVGSPLGIFIILKEHDGHVKRDYKGAKSFLPSCMCSRIHNLHHPSDPVVSNILYKGPSDRGPPDSGPSDRGPSDKVPSE